jgi:hypothetical protein
MDAPARTSCPGVRHAAFAHWANGRGSPQRAFACRPPPALAPEAVATPPSAPAHTAGEEPFDTPHCSPARYLWAMLLARIYEAFPLTCPQCGTKMRMIAFLTEASTVQRILNHIGESTAPPRITPARRPQRWEEKDCATIFLDEERFTGDALAQPQPSSRIRSVRELVSRASAAAQRQSFPLSVSYDLLLLGQEKPRPGAAPHHLDFPKAPHLALHNTQRDLDRRLRTVDISA